MVADKRSVRERIKQARRALAADTIQGRSVEICRHLGAWLAGQPGVSVLSFLALPGEPDLANLPALASTSEFFYPRITGPGVMEFRTFESRDELEKNTLGVWQPTAGRLWTGGSGVILVPALACDAAGNRLGFGGGYYDRFLDKNRILTKIAVLYHQFLETDLPCDPWDVPVDGYVTESGLKIF